MLRPHQGADRARTPVRTAILNARAQTEPAAVVAAFAPALFVVLWSSGFVGTKIGLRDSPPLTLLTMRFAGAAILLVCLAWYFKVRWSRDPRTVAHLLVAGMLIHAGYVGFSFEANAMGMPVSILSLIGVLQPVLTALGAAWLLHERVSILQWIGLALGCAGVALVLLDRVAFVPTLPMVACAFASTLALTVGTLYQKRYCADTDLLSGTAMQLAAATILVGVIGTMREAPPVDWQPSFVAALVWLTIVNSVISTLMLYWLIRRGAASRVTSLFYLVPVATSIMGYILVDEAFGRYFLVGAVVTICGVMLALRARGSRAGGC
jgi:drug/metabolite transporter (DMT)-like permease